MTQIFLIHAPEDATVAERIGASLQTKNYTFWQPSPGIDPESISYARAFEVGVQGSAALVLVWSAAAAQSPWVERLLLYGQRLRKRIVIVRLDASALPPTLVEVSSIVFQAANDDLVALFAPHLPPANDDDLLLRLLTGTIKERKQGIQRAAGEIMGGTRREELLAHMDDLARADLMPGVRSAAQAVVDEARPKDAVVDNTASRHIFGARCPNGHVTYFDKRNVCPAHGTVERTTVDLAGKALDELLLNCGTCHEQVVVRVDCEGYR